MDEFDIISLPFIKLLTVSEPIIPSGELNLLNGEACFIKAVLPNVRKGFSVLDWISETLCDEVGQLIFIEAFGVLKNLPPSMIFEASKQIQNQIQKANPDISKFTMDEFNRFEKWIKSETKKHSMEGLKLSMCEKPIDYFGKGLVDLNDIQSWCWHMELTRRKEK